MDTRPIQFSDGSHMVGLYTSEDHVLKAIVPFFVDGLKSNNYCFYAAPESTLFKVKTSLSNAGINVDQALEAGQLGLSSDKEPLLKDGRFEPDFLVDLWRGNTDQALKDGWDHIRATAEMSWLVDGVRGREDLLYYEALSTDLFNDTDKIHALCQYNTARMKGAEIVELLKIHPWALMDGQIGENPFWINPKPEEYASP